MTGIQPQVLNGTLRGTEKLNRVSELMRMLATDLGTPSLTPEQRDAALDEIKTHGRDPPNADPIFTKEGIRTLSIHAMESDSTSTSRHALRVLFNTLTLRDTARQMFVDLQYEKEACAKINSGDWEDEFLVSRIVFLTTYGTSVDLANLIKTHHINDAINQNLARHVEHRASSAAAIVPMEPMALNETLKLLFNITNECKDQLASFAPSVPCIIDLLHQEPINSLQPLDPPVVLLINALLNLDLSNPDVQASVYPPNDPARLATRLMDILGFACKAYDESNLEASATALLGVLRALHEYAPPSPDDGHNHNNDNDKNGGSFLKTHMRTRLLPTETDRSQVLGHTPSLASWLLRNSTNPLMPLFREATLDLLYDLSGRDAHSFVENIGFGYASGYLYNHGIPMPANAGGEGERGLGAGTGQGRQEGMERPFNPITGQFLDAETPVLGPEMSVEEKEREAERLFVLFERLRANGVIDIENPMRTAQQEGRFEELPDDFEEEEVD